MRKQWITWEQFSKGYTEEDYCVDKLKGCLPLINSRTATYDELQELYAKVLTKKEEILSMRKSKKQTRILENWNINWSNTVFSSLNTGDNEETQ